MKKLLLVGIVALMGSTFLQAVTPKHEHRAAWVATVYRLDWPTSYGTTTTVANKQKQEADAFISSLATNNYNAVYFQVRPRADAMYNSAYEPWSSDLTGSRGSTPA
ncbi:MAG: family 10 glycosylhydrolase, partial [Muribaculaceae bacterium]|nr:family 10 glycosylhydrolase [Muribaculaceae bacterium]